MNNDKVDQLRNVLSGKNRQPAQDSGSGASETAEDTSESTTDDANHTQEVENLKLELEGIRSEIALQKDQFLRQIAEAENRVSRIKREQEEQFKFANEKILREIFPVLDSLEMTLEHGKDGDPLVEGVRLVHKQFLGILNKYGLTEVGVEGESFDPHFHEAIATEADPQGRTGCITKVHRRGYLLQGRLVRAALVTVGN